MDVPDSEQGDFRHQLAVDISNFNLMESQDSVAMLKH